MYLCAEAATTCRVTARLSSHTHVLWGRTVVIALGGRALELGPRDAIPACDDAFT